jgi:hypothetical protein
LDTGCGKCHLDLGPATRRAAEADALGERLDEGNAKPWAII